MILGIGVDILDRTRLCEAFLQPGDPFVDATYAPEEQVQAAQRDDRIGYLAGRFAAKEAICKCLGLGLAQKRVLLREICVLSNEDGAPFVSLTGELKDFAESRGIRTVLLSLSYDGNLVTAFALAQGESDPNNPH